MNVVKTIDNHLVGCAVRLITWTDKKWKANTQSWFVFAVFLCMLFCVLGHGLLGTYFYNKRQYLLAVILCCIAVFGAIGLLFFVYIARFKKRMLGEFNLVSNLRKLWIMRLLAGFVFLYLFGVYIETDILAVLWYSFVFVAIVGMYYIMSARSIIESIPGKDNYRW